jgi:hypothetical protein
MLINIINLLGFCFLLLEQQLYDSYIFLQSAAIPAAGKNDVSLMNESWKANIYKLMNAVYSQRDLRKKVNWMNGQCGISVKGVSMNGYVNVVSCGYSL